MLLILSCFFFPPGSFFATFNHLEGLYQNVRPVDFSSVPKESHTSGESSSNSLWTYLMKRKSSVSLWEKRNKTLLPLEEEEKKERKRKKEEEKERKKERKRKSGQ